MTTSNKGLKFGSFEDLDPEVNKRILSFLKSGNEPPSLKLYWETQSNKYNSTPVKSTTVSTVIQDGKVDLSSGAGDSSEEGQPEVVTKPPSPVLLVSPGGDAVTDIPPNQPTPSTVVQNESINSQSPVRQDPDNALDGWSSQSGGQKSEAHHLEGLQSATRSMDRQHLENAQSDYRPTEDRVTDNEYPDNHRFESQHCDRSKGSHSERSHSEDWPPARAAPGNHQSESGTSETRHSESSRPEGHHSDTRLLEGGRTEIRHSETREPEFTPVVPNVPPTTKLLESRDTESSKAEGNNKAAAAQHQYQPPQMQPPHQLMHQQHQVMQHQPMQHQPLHPQPHHQPMQQQSMQHQQHHSMQQHHSVSHQQHPQQHQHQQSPDQRAQPQTAAGLFKNYFPSPPVHEYVPPPVPVPISVQRDTLGPPCVRPPPHVDVSFNMTSQQRWTDEQARGHVDDTGVYHRPAGGPSPVSMPGQNTHLGPGKPFDRKFKKKRSLDYYDRMNQPDPNQIQNMGNMQTGYNQASVSVRQAMEAPSSSSYASVPGSQPGANVISSQYGHQMQQQQHANFAGLMQMNPGLMIQQMLLQQHQVNTQQQQQPQYLSQQDFAACMAITAQGYQPHYGHATHLQHAQSNMYHGQPNVPSPSAPHNMRGAAAGLNQTSGRSMPINPTGLAPSQHGLLGRSPPHTSPIVPGYPEPRLLERHGYHPQQAHPLQPSATVPAQLIMPQGPLPNLGNAFGNLSSANNNNPAHKEVLRTSGPSRVPVMVTSPPHQPPQISTFVTPPQNHEPKLPGNRYSGTVPPFTPAQQQQNVTCARLDVAPANNNATHAAEIPPVDKVEEGSTPLGAPLDVAEPPHDDGPPKLSQQPQPASPVIPTDKQEACSNEAPQSDDLQNEVDSAIGSSTSTDNNAGSAALTDASSPGAEPMPDTEVDGEIADKDTGDDSDSADKSSFTLTFGTVQDIATMIAQPVSEVAKDLSKDGLTVDVAEEGEAAIEDSVKFPVPDSHIPESDSGSCTDVPASAAAAAVNSKVNLVASDGSVELLTSVQLQTSGPTTTTSLVPTHQDATNVPKPVVPVEEPLKERPTAVVRPINTDTPAPVPTPTKPAEPAQPQSMPAVVEPTPVPAVSAWGAPRKWSAFFSSGEKAVPGGACEAATVSVSNHVAPVPCVTKKPEDMKDDSKELKKPVATVDDSRAKSLGDFLLGYTVKYTSVSLQPRGLYNRSNWCYINATLQALLACPALYQMMKALPLYKHGTRGSTSTPVMDCMVQFVNEYTEMAPQQLRHVEKSSGKGPIRCNADVRQGQPFEPVNILKMLQVIQYNTSFKYGRQEDAEEFMSCILNALHDEMVACMNTARPDAPPDAAEENGERGLGEQAGGNTEEDDQWEQVGPKNKSVVTRSQAKLKQSPISDVFGGQMRSVFHAQGQKESATLQPFFCLQLDVQSEKVWTIEDALDGQAAKEIIHGYTDATTKQEVEAYRRLFIDDLPPVLIMHLKCFIYLQTGGAQKVIKNFEFKTDLTIAKELMSPNARSKFPAAKRNYELFAVVNHHGTRVIGGHYTADVFHSGLQLWIRLDDSSVRVVSAEKVVQFEPPRFPYLLYYRRKDLN